MLYFNSQAVGGAGDGDYGNFLNFWTDADDTIPSGLVPTTSDDVTLQDSILLLSGSTGLTHDLIGGGNQASNAAIQFSGTISDITVGSGNRLSTSTSTLPCVTVDFEGDPNPSTTAFTLLTSSGCAINNTISPNISDDGTATWNPAGGGADFFGTVTSPSMASTSSLTFHAAVTCPSINMPSSTFNGGITQTGASVTLIYGTLGAAVTWTSVTSISSTGVLCSLVTQSGSTVSYTLGGSGGIVPLTLPTVPSPDDVLSTAGGNYYRPGFVTTDAAAKQYVDSTVAFGVGGATTGTDIAASLGASNVKSGTAYGPSGGLTGTLTVPASQYVLTGQGGTLTLPTVSQVLTTGGSWGVGGSGSTGTATLPSANNVIFGSGAFGIGGTGSTPNWYRPNSATTDVLAAPYVDSTKTFGVGNAVTGTDIAGSLLASTVKNGTAYGPAGAQTGTYTGGGGGGGPIPQSMGIGI